MEVLHSIRNDTKMRKFQLIFVSFDQVFCVQAHNNYSYDVSWNRLKSMLCYFNNKGLNLSVLLVV